MNEDIIVSKSKSKREKYNELLPQIKSLIKNEKDLIANTANISSVLKEIFEFLWVGFYFHKEEDLVLGPFQGPLACTRIKLNEGVCGNAYSRQKVLIVDDVSQFPGHIACSPLSKSEIVIPFSFHNIKGVLDVDSQEVAFFDKEDEEGLLKIIELLA